MMKSLLIALIVIGFLSCNNSENGGTDSTSNDAATSGNDTVGDTRGMRGTGTDNSGGTPGPGTITDTFKGKTDTADHTSRKDSVNK